MPVIKNRKDKSSNITVVKDIRDYSKDPVFMEKAEYAREFFEKHEFPKSVEKKSK